MNFKVFADDSLLNITYQDGMVVADLLGLLAVDGYEQYNILTCSIFEDDKPITIDDLWETPVNPTSTYWFRSDQMASSTPLEEFLLVDSESAGSPTSLHSSDATLAGAPGPSTTILSLLDSQQTASISSPQDPATTGQANLLDSPPSQPLPATTHQTNLPDSPPSQPLPATTDQTNLPNSPLSQPLPATTHQTNLPDSPPSQPLPATEKSTALFICPVPGCGVAHKKPWNHLYQGKRHKTLSADDKKRFLELTRLAGPTNTPSVKLEINQVKATSEESQTAQYTITTTGRQKFGDTRSLPSIPPDNPELLEFAAYLKSVAGGGKSPDMAKQFCIDLGKYLKFASDSPTIMDVLSFAKISEYLEKIRALGLGPSGQAAKLTVLKTAMKFLQFQ